MRPFSNHAMGKNQPSPHTRGLTRRMRDHQHCSSGLGCTFQHEIQDFIRSIFIQIAGWFVGEDELGTCCQSACNRNSLLLSARQCFRVLVDVLFKAQAFAQVLCPCGVEGVSQAGVKRDVSRHGKAGHKIDTAPAEQTAQLMPECFEQNETLSKARMLGCHSLMLGGLDLPDVEWDAAVVKNSPIAWIAMNHSKPGRSHSASLLCQSDNEWSQAYLEHDAEAVQDMMLNALAEVTPAGATPSFQVHSP